MCVVYGLNYLDKTTISYANVMGFQDDLGLVGDQYSWLSSMFYFGYLAWEYVVDGISIRSLLTWTDTRRTVCCSAFRSESTRLST